jgi:predicted dehydrogenase
VRKLRCGVIGVGQLGQHHARIYGELAETELVGIHDSDTDRMGQIARMYRTRAYQSIESLLCDVEAVSLAVPTTLHYGFGKMILDEGKHLLIEKPITSTVAQGEHLVRMAEQRKVVLYAGHTERFGPALRSARRWIRQPKFVEALRLAGFGLRGTDVSVIHDLMIHDIDLVLSTVDSEIEKVEAIGVPVFTPNVDIANARLSFRDGTIAALTASRVSIDRLRKLRFFQGDAYISIDSLKKDVKIYKRRTDTEAVLASSASGFDMQDLVQVIAPPVPDEEPLNLEIQDFVLSVVTRKKPEVPGRAGVEALAIACQIVEDIEARVAMWRE